MYVRLNKRNGGGEMTEELFWRRAKNLHNIINAIKDDIVYKTMWQDKLKELMKRKDVYE